MKGYKYSVNIVKIIQLQNNFSQATAYLLILKLLFAFALFKKEKKWNVGGIRLLKGHDTSVKSLLHITDDAFWELCIQ